MRIRFRPGTIALLAALPLAACDQAAPTEVPNPSFDFVPVADIPIASVVPQGERVWLCKVDEDATGTSFSFDVTGTRPADLVPPPTSLSSGICRRIAFGGGASDDVTITETVPLGFEVSRITVDNASGADPADITDGSNTVTVAYAGTPSEGAVVTFYNRLVQTGGGGEGCTPGYWGRPQHFDSWTAPYTTSTTFLSVFGVDAYPGMTLLDVVNNPGPPKKQLGRMAVAALLNAASAGVSFDLTTAEVIAAFNAAWASGDYETTKDMLDDLNNQGCPLN